MDRRCPFYRYFRRIRPFLREVDLSFDSREGGGRTPYVCRRQNLRERKSELNSGGLEIFKTFERQLKNPSCTYFIDEDDCGRPLFGLLEELANPGGAHTDENFVKLRTGGVEKRNSGLSGHRAGQEGFTFKERKGLSEIYNMNIFRSATSPRKLP